MANQQVSQDSKLFGALSYLWLLSVVMLILKKDDEFVRFHAKQGTVIFVASIILWFIPIIGWLMQIAVLVGVVIGFLKAYSGERFKMPVVGDLADKINI